MRILELRDERQRGVDIRIRNPPKEEEPRRRGPRIRCPRCGWEPERDSLWMCICLHTWNTFETSGRCPACGQQWQDTCCLRCHKWSPHRDWYEDEPEA